MDYARDLKRVLEKFKEYKLYVNAEKNEFALSELKFLGHMSGDMESAWTRTKSKKTNIFIKVDIKAKILSNKYKMVTNKIK